MIRTPVWAIATSEQMVGANDAEVMHHDRVGDTSAGTTLRAHLSESFDLIIEEMTQLVLEEVPELAEVAGPQAIRESAQANVEVLLQLMDHPEDLNRISAPLGAIALVRHAAQRGTPFYQVVRGYQLAESFWNQVCMRAVLEEQETFGTPMPMLTEASRVVHAYVDRICGQLSEEYALTDERVRSHLRSRQMKRITSILAGTTGSLAEAESDLRFRLNRRHLASVLWFDDRRDPGTGMAELKRLPAVVGAALGTSTQPLVAVRNESTVWTWFRVADDQQTDEIADQVRQACRDIDGAKVALGLPASGVDGFVSSHRQATTAHSIGSLGGSQHRVFAFGEVSCLNFLVSDVARARLDP